MNDHERLERARANAAAASVANGKGTTEDLKFVIEYMDRRTTELLEANSRLVEQRRAAAMEASDLWEQIKFLLTHNGVRQISDLEDARQHAEKELETVRAQRDAAEAHVECLLAQIEKLKANASS